MRRMSLAAAFHFVPPLTAFAACTRQKEICTRSAFLPALCRPGVISRYAVIVKRENAAMSRNMHPARGSTINKTGMGHYTFLSSFPHNKDDGKGR